MADVKISQLPSASTPLAGTEVLPIVQGGVTSKVAISDVTAGRATSMTSVTVAAGAVGTPSITTTGDTNTGIFFPAADTIAFAKGGAEVSRFTSGGDFLVGTTTNTPSAPFAKVIVGGAFRTIYAGGSVANASSATLFTITVDSAYLVTVQTGNASGLSVTALVRYVSGGNPAAATILSIDNAAFTVTVSGTSVQITNALGGNVVYAANIVRIF